MLPTLPVSFEQLLLKTDRLILRPLKEADVENLFTLYSDREVARFLSFPAWTSRDQANELIEKDKPALHSGEYLRLGLVEEMTGRLIGTCSLFNRLVESRRAEIGYALSRASWGKGYMNEALTALLRFGFTDMDLNRVEADVDPRNTSSIKSLERLGFVREGLLK